VVPVASLVRSEDGMVTYTVGGSIIARADDTSLHSLSDLAGRKVQRLTTLAGNL